MSNTGTRKPLTMLQVVVCSSITVAIAMGIRHGFGLWLQPVTLDRQWTRESFALAIAFQNLFWGLTGPFVGAISDRFGSLQVLIVGSLLYAAGLVLMAISATPMGFLGSAGLLIGMAQAGTTYSIVFGIIGRNVAPEKRVWAMSITATAGSFGQFLMVPVESGLIQAVGWQNALFGLAALAILIVPAALAMREPRQVVVAGSQSAGEAIKEAFSTPSFLLLTTGYFVCGFQLAFIGVHLPSYLKDNLLSPQVATIALALVGLFNVFGSYLVGVIARAVPNRYILSGIYTLRGLVIVAFVLLPLSPVSVYVFAAAMGLLWLSTVPPTNAVIAQIFGIRYLSTLSGFAFLSHQIGSFMGVWLGGRLYDATGSYTVVWWLAAALAAAAALINLPIREKPVVRGQPVPAP